MQTNQDELIAKINNAADCQRLCCVYRGAMVCYGLAGGRGALKQGETIKMLVARSNMSENILFRTRCKDRKNMKPRRKMIRARLVS